MQRLILFLLQRGTKPFHLIIAGFFPGSLESCGTVTIIPSPIVYVIQFYYKKYLLQVLTASVSYFTFLYSTSRA